MFKKYLLPLVALILVIGGATYALQREDVLVTIGSHKITQNDYDLIIQDIGIGKTDKVDPKILNQFVDNHILSEEAKKIGLTDNDTINRRINLMKTMIYREAYIEEFLKNNLNDDVLKSTYEKEMESYVNTKEYHAAHILVDEKKEIELIHKDLLSGKDFKKLAQKHSKDPSAQNGGDLGYFTLDVMVKPFADAVKALEKGKFSTPIKTDFGWHIVHLIDVRNREKPSFDSLKPRLKAQKAQTLILDELKSLRKKYNVVMHNLDKENQNESGEK